MAFTDKVIDGGDILLSVNGLVISCATSHSIELTNAVREISCKGSGDFTSAEYGRFSWTASTDALMNLGKDSAVYVSYSDLMQLMVNKTLVTINSFYREGVDAMSLKGQCIITSINQTSGDSENASYSVGLQGRGDLELQTGVTLVAPVLSTPTMGATTADLDWTDPNGIPGESGVSVESSTDGINWVINKLTNPNVTSYQIAGLQTGIDYMFRVKALGSISLVGSEYSNVVTGTTA